VITLLVMTDGRRDCITRTLASFAEMVTGPVTRRIIHDDSADHGYGAWLSTTYPGYEVVSSGRRRGFGGAIAFAWRYLTAGSPDDADLDRMVFHLEDDFVFRRSVELADLAAVLDTRPGLAQLALRRQPWNEAERAAGGIVEQNPQAYEEHADFDGRVWLEHRQFFTTNPSLYRSSLCERGWPDGRESEGHFGLGLLATGTPEAAPADVRFGFWGSRDSGEWVEHIGAQRAGSGY